MEQVNEEARAIDGQWKDLARRFRSAAAAMIWTAVRAALRLVSFCVVVMLAALAGAAIPIGYQEEIAQLGPAGLVFGGATILAVLQKLIASAPIAWDYVVHATRGALPKFAAEISVAALGLGFAYYSAVSPASAQPQVNLSVAGSLPPLVMHDSDPLLTFYVVFEEKSATLRDGDAQPSLVKNLVASLLSCLQSESDLVRVSVRGFASSSGSDADNDALSRDRAATVKSLIDDSIRSLTNDAGEPRLQVKTVSWKSLEIMKVRRLFRDVDASERYSEDAGRLNRRAEVRVHSAGSCYTG